MDKDFLLDYTRFVDEVTSDASRDAQALSDSLDVIDGFGVSPERVLTAAIGISAEGGEFAEIVKKCIFQGKPMDDDAQYHMKRELGDIMWYVMQACMGLEICLDEVIEMNVDKLKARYPGGEFDVHYSENRKEGDL